MRFKVKLEIEGSSMSIDYRRKILHLVKSGMTQYSKEVFDQYFNKNSLKEYTWTCFFKNTKFTKEKILFNNNRTELVVDFSFYSYNDGINIYNSLVYFKNKERRVNFSKEANAKIKSIQLINEKTILDNQKVFKVLSPVVCRNHDQITQKDQYLKFTDKNFVEILKRNLLIKLQSNIDFREIESLEEDIYNLKFDFLNCKNTVIKHYDKNFENIEFKGNFINGTLGNIQITGEKYLLKFIYEAGLGSITGNGFGMLEVI
jgi:CRISPR-associated endoribonuclease cas6